MVPCYVTDVDLSDLFKHPGSRITCFVVVSSQERMSVDLDEFSLMGVLSRTLVHPHVHKLPHNVSFIVRVTRQPAFHQKILNSARATTWIGPEQWPHFFNHRSRTPGNGKWKSLMISIGRSFWKRPGANPDKIEETLKRPGPSFRRGILSR